MGNNIKVLFIVSALFLSACASYVPDRVISNFTYCYDSTINYSNSKIKFNGYYLTKKPTMSKVYNHNNTKVVGTIQDTAYQNIMFFKDGICIREFMGFNNRHCYGDSCNSIFQGVVNKQVRETSIFYSGSMCGLYKIQGDTIKVLTVNRASPNAYWLLAETWYKMIDENTIIAFYGKNVIENKATFFNMDSASVYKFIETNIELPSSIWLKSYDWFWCDKKYHGK